MSTQDRDPSPVGALAAVAVENCLEVIDARLGPLDDGQRHVITIDLCKVVADFIQREAMTMLTGRAH